jgi:hypothetical protein
MVVIDIVSSKSVARMAFLILACVAVAIFAPIQHSSEAAAALHQQTSSRKSTKAKSAAAPLKELPVTFRTGEVLKYQVSWAAFATAANVEVSVPERRELYGWQTWHFRAAIHTVNTVRSLFTIDDQFDSYTDATTFESRQYENYLSEMGRKFNDQWKFIPEGQTPRAPGPAVIVLPGTRDPVGVFYGLRSVDWQKTPEVHWPVYDGRNLYDMRAKLEGRDDAETVPAGKFSTDRVSIHLFQQGKEVSGINFSAWFANNAARTAVLMKAELPFGSLQVQLVSSTP